MDFVMLKNKPASKMAGGVVVLLSLLLAACDSGSDASDLQNRVDVAVNNYTLLQMSAINNIIEVDQSLPLTLNALRDSQAQGTSVADSAVWSVDNPNIATVDGSGMLTGISDGMVNVRARYGPLFSATNVQVSSADLLSIQISAPVARVDECSSVQLTASGTYNDNLDARNLTKFVSWAMDETTTVGAFDSSDPLGLIRTSGAGQLSVTATRHAITVDPAFNLEVLDNLNRVAIDVPTGILTISNDLQLSAQATYEDGTTADITDNVSWSVNATNIATIGNSLSSKGLLNASQTGSVTVSAVCGGVPAEMLTVLSGDPTVIESISFNRNSGDSFPFSLTTTINLRATAQLQTQQSENITEDSNWTLIERGDSQNELNNRAGSKGELTIRGVGTIRVQVEYTGDKFDGGRVRTAQLEIIVR